MFFFWQQPISAHHHPFGWPRSYWGILAQEGHHDHYWSTPITIIGYQSGLGVKLAQKNGEIHSTPNPMDEHINENLGTYLGHIQHIPTYSNIIQYPTFSGCQHVRMSVIPPLARALLALRNAMEPLDQAALSRAPRIPRLGPEVYEVYGTLGWRNVPPFRVSLLNLIRFSRIIMDNWLQDESRKANLCRVAEYVKMGMSCSWRNVLNFCSQFCQF